MSRLLILALVLLPACAPATGGVIAAPTGPTQVIASTGRGASIGSGDEAFAAPVRFSATRSQVWNALLASFADLGVPLGAMDAGEGQTASSFVVNGSLLGEPASRFLTCGGTAGIAEVADRYQMEVRLNTSLVSPLPGVSEVQFRLAGTARDRFTSTAPRPCLTRGALEERFAARIRERLGLAGPSATPTEAAPERVRSLVERAPEDQPAAAGPVAVEQPVMVHPSHPLLLTLAGAAAGGVGTLLGSQVGSDCEKRCLNARGMLGPLVANTVMIPLGTHALNRGRGSLVRSFLVSAGWAAAGAVLAGFTDDAWPVYAIAPGQVLTSVLIERSSTGQPHVRSTR